MANMLKPSGVNNIWASTGVKTDPGSIKANTGWVVELPPYQTANWIEFRQDSFIAHSNQHGIPEWDAQTEYQGNISYTKGSNGIVYKCLITNTNTDPANPLNNTQWVQAFEAFGAVSVVQAALNAHLINYSTLAGIGNTAVARTNLAVYSKTESDVRYAALGGLNTQAFSVATATLPAHAVPLSQFSSLLTQATEATAGIAQIATGVEVNTGTNDTDMVTPLKLATSYLSKAGNLAGLGNQATARTNLGLGSAATAATTAFLQVANNLSDLNSPIVARANLGLTSVAVADPNVFVYRNNNLADILDKAAARNNLGLTATATTDPANFCYRVNNLGDLTNMAQARANLGLSDSGLYPSNTWLNRGNNLNDLFNVQTARNNLGLGNLATRNVFGVAGDLNYSTYAAAGGGYAIMPGGIILQWGQGPALGDDQGVYMSLHIAGTIMTMQVTGIGVEASGVGPCFMSDQWTLTTFRVANNYNSGPYRAFTWFAVVYAP